jgi:hypothetical protein
MAACVQFGGWTAAAVLGAAVSLVALPLAWRAASAATRDLRPLKLPGAARAD